jgi:hypothetical protein
MVGGLCGVWERANRLKTVAKGVKNLLRPQKNTARFGTRKLPRGDGTKQGSRSRRPKGATTEVRAGQPLPVNQSYFFSSQI